MWQFVSDNPVVALLVVAIFAVAIYELAEMFVRGVNIAIHGWPPPHLDANGRFKEHKEKESDEDGIDQK